MKLAGARPVDLRLRRTREETGSATVELVLTVPVLILALWFLVLCGRTTDARLRIEDAAHQAARAASSERTAAAAAAHARKTSDEALQDEGVTCRELAVRVTGSVRPGGAARASVTCRVDLSDLGLLRVPGGVDLSADFTSPVDVYRGTTLGFTKPEVSRTTNRSVGVQQ
ncbi:TadE family protein [Streptomyces sp. SDT5-1]|uniref:TadE family protein n=1 Tax=Streptomyces sp. SDT5-1 TaxID=3406418 RepID=UPI003FD3A7A0